MPYLFSIKETDTQFTEKEKKNAPFSFTEPNQVLKYKG